MNECYQCKYRGDVPGDTHSCCKYPGNNTGFFGIFDEYNMENRRKLNIRGDAHGISNGWFLWPITFDPVWLINCNGFTRKKKENE